MTGQLNRHTKGVTLSGKVLAMLAAVVCCGLAHAAELKPLFASDEVMSVVLRAPLTTIRKQRKLNKRDEVQGMLQFKDGSGLEATLEVGVRSRGNYRRKNCRHPPLRLNFKGKPVKGTLFEGQEKLKLVSPCKSGQRYEELIVSEYLVYRTYSILSDYSFRVRPLDVDFIDTEKKKSSSRRSFAFLIEDMHDMAARHGKIVPDWERTKSTSLDPVELGIVEVFQFMVGGHDWSVIGGPKGERCCHNARLIVDPGWEVGVIPVPYDFDLTGMVDAPYAFPPEKVPIRSVRQRYFRGRCKGPELWQLAFDRYREKKSAIYDLYRNETRLANKAQRKALKYLDAFYRILENDKKREKAMTNRCRGTVPT